MTEKGRNDGAGGRNDDAESVILAKAGIHPFGFSLRWPVRSVAGQGVRFS